MMRKIITRAQAVRAVAWIILGLLILAIFPCRLFKEDIVSKGNEQPAGSVNISMESVALQQFAAEYDHIDSIGIKLKGTYSGVPAVFRIFKESTGELLREIPFDVNASDGYADVYINLDAVVGDNYFYTVESPSGSLEALFEMTANSGAHNNGYMQYAGENKDAYNLVTRYTYRQPLRKGKSLIIIGILVILGFAVGALKNYLEKKFKALSVLTNPASVTAKVCTPCIILGAVAAMIAIGPLHMFSIYYADIIVMILGVLILAGFGLYFVNVHIKRTDTDISLKMIPHILQSVCIAMALLACVHYMNGLYEVFHDIEWRRMAFFLGLAIIVTFKYSELVNIYNPVLLIAGIITARIYYVKNLPDMVDEFHVNAMFWTCMCIPVIFIMAAYIVRCIVLAVWKKNIPQVKLSVTGTVYALFTMAVAVGMIVRRNTRYWPVVLAVIGGVYVFRLFFWDDRRAFTDNLTRGILFHFAGCVIYCLMHRPYEAYQYVRFPLVFHTVTITAEYMALVMAAAFVRLFSKYRREKCIRGCIWEMFVFGCVSSYMFFTMSRTAMIGIVATGFVMWIAYCAGVKTGKKSPALITCAGMVVCSMTLGFFVFFTAQKSLPAVVGEPKLMEIEKYPQTLLISKDYDSDDYITFTRFAKAFAHKMAGLDEDLIKFDRYTIYGRRDDIYVKYSDADSGSLAKDGYSLYVPQPALMLTPAGETLRKNGEGFVPPHEYDLEGDPPPQWYDEDYWALDPTTGEWEFAYWKVIDEENSDVTNGRTEIFRSYYEQLNDEGHEDMGALLPDGSIAAHAHNIYLQVAYDNGKIIGIMFAIWCLVICIRSMAVFIKKKDADLAVGILPAVSVTYTVCGITEWISHPCNPVGMILMLVAAALVIPDITDKTDETI